MQKTLLAVLAAAAFALAPFAYAASITPPNRAPIANDDTYWVNVDGTLAAPATNGVLTNDTDDDGDALSATLGSPISNASSTLTLGADGSFTFTPQAGWSGVESFTYNISDGSLTSSATVYIVVSNNDEVPLSDEDIYTTDEGTLLSVAAGAGILANDSDPNGHALTASLESDVNDGALALAADGSFTYTPDAGFSGIDSFIYKASNGSFFSSARTVVINVRKLNSAPVAADQHASTTQDVALAVTLAATDADGDTLTYATSSNPLHGALTGTAPALTYTPATGFVGSDSFTFSASDATSTSNIATVFINIASSTSSGTGTTTGSGTSTSSTGSGSSGGSSGHHSSHHSSGGSSTSGGEVLGAQIGPLCAAPYINNYLRIGQANDPYEVAKLQIFLNNMMKAGLPLTGSFDTATFSAVEAFQVAYADTVLKPWVPFGLPTDHTPTGYVYKTTKWQINNLMCPGNNYPAPVLP